MELLQSRTRVELVHVPFAPGGTPPALLDRIHAAINKVVEDPEIGRRLAGQGFEPLPMSCYQFAARLRADFVKWSETIRKLGIKPR